jgi:hypothetical protein
MTDEVTPSKNNLAQEEGSSKGKPSEDYEEFEIGHHQVPWFLWVFFTIIVTWASVSWVKFFGY